MPTLRLFLLLSFVTSAFAAAPQRLHLRERIKVDDAERYQLRERNVDWDPTKTAVVVCDMWDQHWCQCSTKRVGELAPRMNELIAVARERGMLIIHCPSDTMEFYKDTPQRKLAQSAPVVEGKAPLERWRRLDPSREPPLPIDDSDGGCDDSPQPKSSRAWSRQHAALEIKDGDAITDSAEAYYLMRQRGIENVLVMGVHTNMCVLGRPFSIRQLVYQGMNVVLVRDMTDTMYNPAKAPQVSHFRGTDLVIEHIEKYWCPSIVSSDLTGKSAFAFADDPRPHAVFVIGEDEYQTQTSLPQFATDELEPRGIRCSFVFADERAPNRFPLINTVEDADVLVLSVRRRPMPMEQLDVIRRYCRAGKPLVAVRTASHAFAPRGGEAVPEGCDTWLEFDTEILGAKYNGHYGRAMSGPSSQVWFTSPSDHPLTKQMPQGEFPVTDWLYKYSDVADSCRVLMSGRPNGGAEVEAASWINTKRGRVFYTMLGHPDAFQQATFREFLRRGVFWALEKEAAK